MVPPHSEETGSISMNFLSDGKQSMLTFDNPFSWEIIAPCNHENTQSHSFPLVELNINPLCMFVSHGANIK